MSRWWVLAALPVMFLGRPARADDGTDHRERAAALRDAGMDREALVEWKEAYAVRQEPRLLYEMACAYQKLNLPRQASELFRRYLVAEPSLDDAIRGEVEARLHLLAGPKAPPPPEAHGLPDGAQLVPVHYKTRARRSLLTGGILLLTLAYAPTVVVGALSSVLGGGAEVDTLLLPVVGPFISALLVREAVWSLPWILDGIAQVAGLAMIISAARNREKVPVFGERLTVVPFADPRGAGLAAFGRF
jgi:hypothetical protein